MSRWAEWRPLGAKVKGGPEWTESLVGRMTATEVICSFQKANGSRELRDNSQCPSEQRSRPLSPDCLSLYGLTGPLLGFQAVRLLCHCGSLHRIGLAIGSLEPGCHLIPPEASCCARGAGRESRAAGMDILGAELTSASCTRWRCQPPPPPPTLNRRQAPRPSWLTLEAPGRGEGERQIKEPFDSLQELSSKGPGSGVGVEERGKWGRKSLFPFSGRF